MWGSRRRRVLGVRSRRTWLGNAPANLGHDQPQLLWQWHGLHVCRFVWYAAAYFASFVSVAWDVPIRPACPLRFDLRRVLAQVPNVRDNERWVRVSVVGVSGFR